MLRLSIRQLEVFSAAARHLSFARAAETLHLSAPAVSMQIRELESTLEVPLFERAGRRISLTTAGEYFLVHARRLLSNLKDAEDTIARLKGVQTGRLTIGVLSTAKYFVPRLMAGFMREHPGLDLNLEVGNRQALSELLARNEVDLAVMGTPPRELDLRVEPFAAHPLGVIAAPEHPLAALPHIPPALLERESFIVREPGSGTRAAMERYFADVRIKPVSIMAMSSNETIKQAVIANMGISFLSLHTTALEVETGLIKVLEVDGLPLVRRWQVVHVRARLLSPAAEAFRYYVLEYGERLLARMFPGLVVAAPEH
jgi:LysR family transcriptional regulator, low CO2-responsive transcriptional regulator